MKKHTPGPWEISRPRELIRIKSGDTFVAQNVTNWEDARLIAAAPDLLEALKEALPYVEGAYECAFPDDQANERIAADIRAAITKAKDTQ